MSIRNRIRKLLKIASVDDFHSIQNKTMFTPIQQDILWLRFKGYDPLDFPNNKELSNFYRKGERLSVNEVSIALNVSVETIKKETSLIFDKIERAKAIPELFSEAGKIDGIADE